MTRRWPCFLCLPMLQSGNAALFWALRYDYAEIVELLEGGPSEAEKLEVICGTYCAGSWSWMRCRWVRFIDYMNVVTLTQLLLCLCKTHACVLWLLNVCLGIHAQSHHHTLNQAAAMKEAYTAASDGNEDLLKKCIADATNVNGYKDEVRS